MKKSKDDLASDNWDAFQRAWDRRHERFVKEADRFNRFYLGEQWDEQLRKELEAGGFPVLTINQVMSATNAVLGHYSDTRVDIRFKPRTGGSDETALVLQHVTDQILDNNKYARHEAQCFADGVIMDAGFLDVRMGFDDTVLGEVEIRSLDPLDVVIDPDAKEYDPATWTQVFVSRWHTLDEITTLYGKAAAKRLRSLVHSGETFGANSIRFGRSPRFGDERVQPDQITGDEALKQLRELRVIERQHRRMTKRRMFVDLSTGDTRPVPDTWDDARTQEIAERYELAVIEKLVTRIRWTVSCDRHLLHDDWSPYEFITVVPFFPMFRRGRFSGIVRQLISPQEQLNKTESQQLRIVNTTANSGWRVEEGSLSNMTPEQLEEDGAKNGLVLVFRRGRTAPEKIQPNQIPTGLDRLGSKALDFIHDVAGTEALVGRMPTSEVSGVALERTHNKAIVKLQPILDNLDYTRHLVAERILKLVQQYYNEARVIRVTDWRQPTQPEVEVEINVEDVAGHVVNNVTLGEYEVVVGKAPARDGAQEMEFAEAIQLREAGVMIPDHVIIASSNLSQKHEVAEMVKRMQGLGEPSDEERQLMERQREIQMQLMELEVQQTMAKVEKLAAEAEALSAKAKNTEMSTELEPHKTMADIRLEVEKLLHKQRELVATLQTKREMAQMHVEGKNAQTLLTTMAKNAQNERQAQVAMAKRVGADTPRLGKRRSD